MINQWILYSLPIVIPLLLIASWWISLSLVSRFGGWSALASEFETDAGLPEKTYYLSSMHIGRWCGYNRCMNSAVSEKGIHLSVLLPFRPGHSPLLIPWSAVERVVSGRLYLLPGASVHLRNFSKPLFFYRAFGEALIEQAKQREIIVGE